MSYRNKTYVIFDGDNDLWAYAYLKGWNQRYHIDFNFFDGYDIRPLAVRASEETIKRRLRERMADAKQVLVLIGEDTKNLSRFVRWQIDLALDKGLPIVGVNLNGKRSVDHDRCPPIMRGEDVVHVSFQMKIIKYALDNFPSEHARRPTDAGGDHHYNGEVYAGLGLTRQEILNPVSCSCRHPFDLVQMYRSRNAHSPRLPEECAAPAPQVRDQAS